MRIERDPKLLESLLVKTQKTESYERDGIHLTDLLYPRQAYWRKALPKPLTMADMLYFIAGRGVEDEFLRSALLYKSPPKQWKGIWYSIDTHIDTAPMEIKSRRRYLAEEGKELEVYDGYLEQLRCYCSMEGSDVGYLAVISLMEKVDVNKTEPVLVVYRVEFTSEELGNTLVTLEETKKLLDHVFNVPSAPNHKALHQCPQWMCGRVLKDMEVLPKCDDCGQEFKTEWGAQKHTEGKKTKGHRIIPPKYKYSFDVRCKWFYECEPEMKK